MKPIELYRCAVAEIGDVSAADLSQHLKKKHGVIVEPAFIPIFKATLQQLEKLKKPTLKTSPFVSIQSLPPP